ncbi:response regulator transcription factor [Bacillus spongiae]|uniref:Response regulator transcription factor n=1 Tax=Bacillus spongiae TaxID=2683610 RepID=A0ABU8HKS2_9BACI
MSEIIIVAEDDVDINHLVSLHLRKEGFEVIQTYDGAETLRKLKEVKPGLVILDLMMPKKSGFQVIKKVREDNNIPIMLLTALGDDANKVLGFELGADDYLVKPFSILELLSRVKAQIRRYSIYGDKEEGFIIQNGGLRYNITDQVIFKNGKELSLKPKEQRLLEIFMKNINKIFSKEQLYKLVWKYDYYNDNNTVMVHISRIREQIEDNPKSPIYITTIKGLGYRMERHV